MTLSPNPSPCEGEGNKSVFGLGEFVVGVAEEDETENGGGVFLGAEAGVGAEFVGGDDRGGGRPTFLLTRGRKGEAAGSGSVGGRLTTPAPSGIKQATTT